MVADRVVLHSRNVRQFRTLTGKSILFDNREVSATTNDVNYERIEGGFQDFSSLCFDQSYVQRAIEDV